jgi:hypothetical protein
MRLLLKIVTESVGLVDAIDKMPMQPFLEEQTHRSANIDFKARNIMSMSPQNRFRYSLLKRNRRINFKIQKSVKPRL